MVRILASTVAVNVYFAYINLGSFARTGQFFALKIEQFLLLDCFFSTAPSRAKGEQIGRKSRYVVEKLEEENLHL